MRLKERKMYKIACLIVLFFCAETAFSRNFESTKNSTVAALSGSSTYTGQWENCLNFRAMSVAVATDQNGTLKMQFSTDAVNLDSSLSYKYRAGTVEPPHRLEILREYCRVQFVNDSASAQTYLRLQTIYGDHGPLSSPLSSTIHQDADATVGRSIGFENTLMVGLLEGYSVSKKRGKNSDIDTGTVPEDVWEGGGTYTGFPRAAVENLVLVSSSASDTGTFSIICLESNTDPDWEVYTYTLTGTTPVDTGQDVYRCHTGWYNDSSDSTFNAGTITARWETTTSVVFLSVPPGQSQSNAAVYTCPAESTCYVWNVNGAMRRSASSWVEVTFWIRNLTGSPRLRVPGAITQGLKLDRHLYAGLRLAAGTDITLRVTGLSTNNTVVAAGFDVIVVKN